jgi:hypothetical protein
LQRIRNFQSQDWYPALVIRPLTIGIMLIIADWPFLTPNRLTTIATLVKLAGAWLILDREHWVLSVVLLQLGIIFDHLDGTLARYRRTFTKLGSYYDKVSDIITWCIIVMVLGWQAYVQSGQAMYILFAAASVIALNIRGYMKWLCTAETERIRWFEAKRDPSLVDQRTAPIVIKPPPERTPREWAQWLAKRVVMIFAFEEMDLWFWLGLGMLIDRIDLVLWLMMLTQVPLMLVMVVVRAVWMARADRQLRELEAA